MGASCHGYLCQERGLYLVTLNETREGLALSGEPMFHVAPWTVDSPPDVWSIGDYTLTALRASHGGLPTPTAADLKAVQMSILRFVGEQTWKRFLAGVSGYMLCEGSAEEGVTVTPGIKIPRGEFAYVPERARQCGGDPHELGRTVWEVLTADVQ